MGKFTIFYVKANMDPEPHLDAGHYFYELLVMAGTGPCVHACSQRRLLDEFLAFST